MKIYSPTITGSAANTNVITVSQTGSLTALSSSFAATSSYANSFTVGGTLTAQTINVQIITSSIEFNTGSTRNGALSSNTHQFTGSVLMSGSLTVGNTATFASSTAGYGITLNHTSENLRLKMGAIAGGIINIQGEVISNSAVYPIVLNYLGGSVGIGASTSPTYKLEVSTAGGSERIRVGTLQNNNNTATFEAITSAGISTATSGWIRAVYGGGLAIGTSAYTKTGGDSGNFANLSAESATTAITVNGGNSYLGTTTFFRTDVAGAQNYGGSTIRVAGGTGTSAAGIQFGDVSSNATGARGRIGFLASANNGNPKEFAIIKGVLDSTGPNTCNGSLTFHTLNGDNATEASTRMTIDGNGSIGAPSGTNIYNASDIRLKQNISTVNSGLNSILALNPVKFNWINDFVPAENGKDMFGFIAQEVLEVLPEAVEAFGGNSITVEDNIIENPLRVNEKFIIPVLVKAIQELKSENDTLKEILQRNNIQ